tara:strand:- start:593 stop:802 length:210 start_codon:yes stop_codon:yes gene_type:complete
MAKKLDLHGVRHHDVERLVENLVLLNDEWEIICGNSDMMIKIVEDKLNWLYDNHEIKWNRNTHNTFRSV